MYTKFCGGTTIEIISTVTMLVALLSPPLTRSEPFSVVRAGCAVHWASFGRCASAVPIIYWKMVAFCFAPYSLYGGIRPHIPHSQLLQCVRPHAYAAQNVTHRPKATIRVQFKFWFISLQTGCTIN